MSAEEKPTSAWSIIKPAPSDPILGVNAEYNKDTDPNKVNLSIGAYKDDKGNPYTLKCVEKAVEKYAKEGIVVFNTPGANANAVKELVLAGLLLSSRDIIGGALNG